MSIDILKTQLKNKDIKSLYLFYGPEDYLKKYYLKSIEKIVLLNDAAGLNRIVAEDKVDIPALIRNCETYPVFSSKKLIVVKNSGFFKSGSGDGEKTDTGKLAVYLKNVPQYVCLVFYENDVDRRVKLYNAIKENGLVVEFPYQKPYDLAKWVVNITRANKKEISMETASMFVDRIGYEMTELFNELNKLISYTEEKPTIELEDVREVCSASVKSRIFDLTDAIVEKDVTSSIKYLNDMINLKEPIPLIMYMIARQFRQMLQVKILSEEGADIKKIASSLKVTPYIAGKIQMRAKGFSLRQINQALKDIFEYDTAIKTGKMKDRTAVDLLVAKLASH